MDNHPPILVSARNSLQILKLFSSSSPELGICEISRMLGLAKSTVSRVVTTLTNELITEKNPVNGKYRLSPLLLELGLIANEHNPFVTCARDKIERLSQSIGMTVSLILREEQQSVCVWTCQNGRESISGERLEITDGPSGLVILAFSEERIDDWLLQHGHQLSVKKKDELQKTLIEIENQGYAFKEDLFKCAQYTLSFPIFNKHGIATSALSVSGPITSNHSTIVQAVSKTAQQLTKDFSKLAL